MNERVPTILYLTYHGLAHPLGRAQCLPYLLRLAREGRARLLVVSWESDPLPDDALRREVADAGIEWCELRYHSRPKGVAKIADIVRGLVAAIRLARGRRVDGIHARSYVPAALALVLGTWLRAPFIFDMLGMLADEYADIGYWHRAGLFYRATKAAERILLRRAAAVIVLTRRNADHLTEIKALGASTRLVVIPCCVDLRRFACAGSQEFPRSDSPMLVYSGGIGTWYMASEMLDFVAVALRSTPNLRFRLITREDTAWLRPEILRRGIPASTVEVRRGHPDEMAGLLCESDVGISFIRPSFSKEAASPNKFAEYLACGLPVVTNAGVGDLDTTMRRHEVGSVVAAFTGDEYAGAWRQVLELLRADARGLRARCRAVAQDEFAAEIAVERYVALYDSLSSSPTIDR